MTLLQITLHKPNLIDGPAEEHVRLQILGLPSSPTAPLTLYIHPSDDLENLIKHYEFCGGEDDPSFWVNELRQKRSLNRELGADSIAEYDMMFQTRLNGGR